MNEFLYKILPPGERVVGESGTIYKYKMLADYHIDLSKYGIRPLHDIKLPFLELTRDGVLTLRRDYLSDGASGPARDTTNIIRAAFIHDALYQLLRLGILFLNARGLALRWGQVRKRADKVLRGISLEDGVWMVRRFIDFWGLRFGGRRAALPEKV